MANNRKIVGATKIQAIARSESPRILRATLGGVALATPSTVNTCRHSKGGERY